MLNKKISVLLVDDDDLIRATFGGELKGAGFNVFLADCAEEGLKLAEKELLLDLAILDIKMPGMSGIEMTPALRQLGLPYIFLTAYDDVETVNSATESGAMGYLVKPIEATKAIPSILTVIERSKEINRLLKAETRLNGALDTGNQVNVAIGIIMERNKIARQEAFDLIRNKARAEQRKVKEVSQEILDAWDTFNLMGKGL